MKEYMREYKSLFVTLIAGICAIICVAVGVNGLTAFKKESKSGGISATGSASRDFTSDLIVWRGSFSEKGNTTKMAYEQIKRDSEIIRNYLLESGVDESEIIFYSVDISQQYKTIYNDAGDMIGEVSDGYLLSQQMSVTSTDVDKIETISRDITKLIDSGVEFISEQPEYYYTKLDELKLEMIEAATENAKARIDIIAENSGSRAGKLLNANLGVFQITGRNSDSEEYTYGGTFNTSSKEKTASITVKLNYEID